MGNCESISNRLKNNSRIISSNGANRITAYSSSSLPKISSYFNKEPQSHQNFKKIALLKKLILMKTVNISCQ